MMKKHCEICGEELIDKFLEFEGMVPFCPSCKEYRFNKYNCAVSMIILNNDETKILYIKQYHKDKYILCAGYVNLGESLEHAVYREIGEELGRYPKDIEFNKSLYFEPSNTLISNFICHLTSEELHPNNEVDSYKWFDIGDAKDGIKDAKLAKKFVEEFIKKRNIKQN